MFARVIVHVNTDILIKLSDFCRSAGNGVLLVALSCRLINAFRSENQVNSEDSRKGSVSITAGSVSCRLHNIRCALENRLLGSSRRAEHQRQKISCAICPELCFGFRRQAWIQPNLHHICFLLLESYVTYSWPEKKLFDCSYYTCTFFLFSYFMCFEIQFNVRASKYKIIIECLFFFWPAVL